MEDGFNDDSKIDQKCVIMQTQTVASGHVDTKRKSRADKYNKIQGRKRSAKLVSSH